MSESPRIRKEKCIPIHGLHALGALGQFSPLIIQADMIGPHTVPSRLENLSRVNKALSKVLHRMVDSHLLQKSDTELKHQISQLKVVTFGGIARGTIMKDITGT